MGPNSRALIESVSGADLSNAAFPFATSREIELGHAIVRASRISYVGELGWELLIPRYQGHKKNNENVRRVFEALWEAGQVFGIRPMGLYAYRGPLRMEKSFPLHGAQSDINVEHSLVSSGALKNQFMFDGDDVMSQVKDRDYIGSPAVRNQLRQETFPEEIICTLMIRGSNRVLVSSGNYPIFVPGTRTQVSYSLNGAARNSYTTSAASAYTLSEQEGEEIVLARAYLPPEYAQIGAKVEISYFQNRIPATVVVVGTAPLYDPENTYTRG